MKEEPITTGGGVGLEQIIKQGRGRKRVRKEA